MKLSNEFLEKAKEVNSIEEIVALAKASGEELTTEQAEEIYARLHPAGNLSDEELDKVAGGVDFSNPTWLSYGYCRNCGCRRDLYGWDKEGRQVEWYCSVCHTGGLMAASAKLPG